MRWILRIFKYLFFFVLACIVIGLLWAGAAWLRGDDKLNLEITGFYATNIQVDTNNAAIAVLGLSAPLSVADSYGWAVSLINKSHELGIAPSIYLEDTIKDRMDFVGDTRTVSCWLARQYFMNNPTPLQPCDAKAVTTLVAANAQILSRYQALMNYNTYNDAWSITSMGPRLIKMQETYIANLVVLSAQDPESALQQSLANLRFYRRSLQSHTDVISRSILMVNYGLAINSLPNILMNGNEKLLMKYMNELLNSLTPFDARDANIAEAVKAEYRFLRPILGTLGNYNRNKIFQFHKEFIAAWNTPPAQADEVWKRFYANYKGKIFHLRDWHSPWLSMLTNHILSGMAVGGDLSKAMTANGAKTRILNLYVQMRVQGLFAVQFPVFVANSPRELYNPFTDKPMEYDAASKAIFFTRTDGIKEGFVLPQ